MEVNLKTWNSKQKAEKKKIFLAIKMKKNHHSGEELKQHRKDLLDLAERWD